MPDFESLSLPLLGGLFALAAAAVWMAGTRLAGFVDALSEKTGAGQAFLGMLLLGGITSLPELAAVSTSAATGNAALAVNNLLGTASINIVLLVIADIRSGPEPLTVVAGRPATLMQGVLSMLLAIAVAMVVVGGEVSLGRIGAGALIVALMAVGALWVASDFERRHVWEVVGDVEKEKEDGPPEERSLLHLSLLIGGAALVILVAGFLLSMTADGIATKTGVSSGLVGFVLVGFATSLPELSSIMAAVRLGRYQMAIGDVFGTNIFNILLIFAADIAYRKGPVLAEAGPFEAIGGALAALVTGFLVVGLLERRDQTVLRMGIDSAGVVIAFGLGLALLARATG